MLDILKLQREVRLHQEHINSREIELRAELLSIDEESQALIEMRNSHRISAIRHAEKLENNLLIMQTLKNQAMRHLKSNPLHVLDILNSEVCNDEAIQQEIVDLIENNEEVFKLIVNSPKRLWESNYKITTAITLKATYNSELAAILGNVLSDNHPVKITLRMVGRLT